MDSWQKSARYKLTATNPSTCTRTRHWSHHHTLATLSLYGVTSLSTKESGLLVEGPGLLAEGPGLLAEGPGPLAEGPGPLAEEPGLLAEGPGLLAEGPGFLAEGPGLLAESLVCFVVRQPALHSDRLTAALS